MLLLIIVPSLGATVTAAPYGRTVHAPGSLSPHGHWDVPTTGNHFLYVDDASDPNSITGFQITPNGLTLVGTFSTGGSGGQYAINQIATTPANASNPPCVFHNDSISGQVESFTVDPATGVLTEVSIITVGSSPNEIRASADGRYVYVTVMGVEGPPSFLDVLAVNSGCSLTLVNSMVDMYANYESIALLGSSQLVAADTANTRIDIYQITNGTQLTLLNSNPSQLFSLSETATGQIGPIHYVFGAGNGSIEAHTVSPHGVLGPVPGSPQSVAGYLLFDAGHQQLITSENAKNGKPVVIALGSMNGSFALLGSAPLPNMPSGGPMAELGSELFVAAGQAGVGYIDACTVMRGAFQCSFAGKFSGWTAGIGVI